MTFEAGHRLGQYEIIATLGAGGMGVVYRAHDTRLRRDVALKILPDLFAGDPERLERFRREAVAIAALDHPNVVTIYAVEEIERVHCLSMKFIEGSTLASLIPPRGLPFDKVLKITLPLVDAISAAHVRGIVHRDLKPANVMIGPDDWVTVLDFGLAKLREAAQEPRDVQTVTTVALTGRHEVMGTVAYMSPEQAEGRPVDARTDIFSLGVMLYEMAAGRRPFQGESNLAVVSSILKDAPPSIAQTRPELPADLDRIIRRCLAKEPERRYQTARDVRNELEDLQQFAAGPQLRARLKRKGWLTAAAIVLSLVVVVAVYRWPPRSGSGPGAMRISFDRLTSQPGAELFPSVSPDGRWVVYAGEGDGDRDIFLQSVGGQTPINLTADSPADDDQPAFSPDGERIAFRSSRGGGGLFVMGRTGEAVRRVTASGFNPVWSPDGKQLAYTASGADIRPQNAEQRGELMAIAIDGGAPRRLHDSGMLPSWSPSGHRIAFSGRVPGSDGSSNIATSPSREESQYRSRGMAFSIGTPSGRATAGICIS